MMLASIVVVYPQHHVRKRFCKAEIEHGREVQKYQWVQLYLHCPLADPSKSLTLSGICNVLPCLMSRKQEALVRHIIDRDRARCMFDACERSFSRVPPEQLTISDRQAAPSFVLHP